MYQYQYARPAYTADCVVMCGGEVLLIRRGNEPFKDCWALPGGFVDEGETSLDACMRELKEETGISVDGCDELDFVGLYDLPGRDPRGWTISAAYYAEVDKKTKVTAGDDAVEAKWFNVNDLPELAFDHKNIITDACLLFTDALDFTDDEVRTI